MKYLMLITCLTLSAAAMAQEGGTVPQKPWTDEYQYGAKPRSGALVQNGQPGDEKTKSKDNNGDWTDQYQYGEKGKDKNKKTHRPTDGEFDVAPGK